MNLVADLRLYLSPYVRIVLPSSEPDDPQPSWAVYPLPQATTSQITDMFPTNLPKSEPHILCNTDSICGEALPALRSSPTLILDCEGRDLGTVGGALSIIILRTTTADPQTYLIDVKSLSTTTLNGVFDLLSSPKIQKIVFDGRADFSAFYHEYGIELYNVIDVQLVDIKSRRARGEKSNEHLKRLCGAFAPREVWKNRDLYEQVHKLSSLGQCLREHQCMRSEDGSDSRPKGTGASLFLPGHR
jgi:hypothetical protein